MDGEEKQAEGSQQIAVQPYTQVFAGLGERIPDALQSDLPKQEQTSEQSIEDINTKAENSLLKIQAKQNASSNRSRSGIVCSSSLVYSFSRLMV